MFGLNHLFCFFNISLLSSGLCFLLKLCVYVCIYVDTCLKLKLKLYMSLLYNLLFTTHVPMLTDLAFMFGASKAFLFSQELLFFLLFDNEN